MKGGSAQHGEVWIVDLGYAAKIRPCLVISIEAEDTDRALTTILPHTTSVRGTRFEVALVVNFLKTGAFDAQNMVTIPHAKLTRKLGSLTVSQMEQIETAIRLWLDLQ